MHTFMQAIDAHGSKRGLDPSDPGAKRVKSEPGPEVQHTGQIDRVSHNVVKYQLLEPLKAMMESSQLTENISQVSPACHGPVCPRLYC